MLTACPLWCRLVLFMLVLSTVAAMPADAVQRALLVGVGDYVDERVSDLKGPPHDVAALQAALIQHGGFTGENITVLLDGAATKRRILSEIGRLAETSRPGDFVLIYLSGHGTSAFNPLNLLPLPHHSGAFLPTDFKSSPEEQLDSLIIGTHDLRPLLEEIDANEVRGLLLIDSCYAENLSRKLSFVPKPIYRTIDLGLTAGLEDPSFDSGSGAAPPYPYRHLATLTASSKREMAVDLTDPRLTLDGKPHGAFTDSLLRTLRQMGSADADHNGTVSHGELFAAVRVRMSSAGHTHSPQLLPLRSEDTGGLLDQGVFPNPQQPAAEEPGLRAGEPLRVKVQGTLTQVTAVVRESDGLVLENEAPDLRVVRADDAIRLLTAGGDQVFADRNEAALIHALRQQLWVHQLLRIPNAAQRFQINVRMDGYSGETFEHCEELSFLTRMDQTAHLLLVNAAPDGTLRVLYPYDEGELAAIRAGRTVQVGGIQVQPPFGIDYVVAVGFLDRPALYDSDLLKGAAFSPWDAKRRELMALLQSADDPNLARQVVRVVTVPSQAPAHQGCDG